MKNFCSSTELATIIGTSRSLLIAEENSEPKNLRSPSTYCLHISGMTALRSETPAWNPYEASASLKATRIWLKIVSRAFQKSPVRSFESMSSLQSTEYASCALSSIKTRLTAVVSSRASHSLSMRSSFVECKRTSSMAKKPRI